MKPHLIHKTPTDRRNRVALGNDELECRALQRKIPRATIERETCSLTQQHFQSTSNMLRSQRREFPPSTGSHFVNDSLIQNQIKIHTPAPQTVWRKLPSGKPQNRVTSARTTFASSLPFAVMPLAPFAGHASGRFLWSRKKCKTQWSTLLGR